MQVVTPFLEYLRQDTDAAVLSRSSTLGLILGLCPIVGMHPGQTREQCCNQIYFGHPLLCFPYNWKLFWCDVIAADEALAEYHQNSTILAGVSAALCILACFLFRSCLHAPMALLFNFVAVPLEVSQSPDCEGILGNISSFCAQL